MNKTVKWVMIGAGIALGIIAIILGSIFITAGVSAGKHDISREEAETIAKQCVSDYEAKNPNLTIDIERAIVADNDRDFHVGSKISNSYYTYEVELTVDGHEYEVEVNARTKKARITEVDYNTPRR